MSVVLIQPHDDDAVLFACWTILRHKPLVVTVFDSYVQPGRGISGTSALERAAETNRACAILGCEVTRLGFRDNDETVTPVQIFARLPNAIRKSDTIYVPAWERDGHPQHNLVSLAFGRDARHYLTYTSEGKSKSCTEVPFEPEWVALKLRALAEFKSQFQPATGCVEAFHREKLEGVCLVTKDEYVAFTKLVDDNLGNLEMTWEGPKPHDFRDMKSRGVRFVHGPLLSFNPVVEGLEHSEHAPGGKVRFKIFAGDDAAIADIGARLTAAGYAWTLGVRQEFYTPILFELAV